MTKTELLQRLSETGVIYDEMVVLRSGEISDFYCDIKKAFGYPDVLKALADMTGALLSPDVTCIAASGYGGLPIAAVVASQWNKKFAAVRNSEKDHGKRGMIEGYIPNKKDVVAIIDDVLTSGSSIKETYSTLEKSGILAKEVVVVMLRSNAQLPIPYSFVFSIDEIPRD